MPPNTKLIPVIETQRVPSATAPSSREPRCPTRIIVVCCVPERRIVETNVGHMSPEDGSGSLAIVRTRQREAQEVELLLV